MANQPNLLPAGQVIVTALHSEVQRSYLEYAMSVIVGRALPDVRDGLKPVHRRILYAMHELGLTPDRPFRKCARVVGDVLGKYHPHGDQAVYDALVRMVQDFSSRYPLLAGHGNFGSVDNDPPAAMRYTETRLAPIGQVALLQEIGEATVSFTDNFDNSQQEPVVLPAQLPNLLLNGSSGIAVGMATNIPPHNLGEVVDGLIALIDRPDLSDRDLLALIPGPDFPTGGEIIDTKGVEDAYLTGRGSIPMRGIAQVEEVRPGRGKQRRTALVVTELPYQVNKAAWIEKMADLVNEGRIQGVADIRDESDRDGMRVVIELRRDATPTKVLADLYRLTPLQSNFGAILLALDQGEPRQLTLRQILERFLTFREATLTRQYDHELERTESRLHVVEGLRTALARLDDLITILRQAPDGATAKGQLQAQLNLSDRQGDAILAMPLRRLTGLEQDSLRQEYEDLTQRRDRLQTLLGDRRELLKALKKELRSLKKQFGDRRRTRIQSPDQQAAETQELATALAEQEAEAVILEFTPKGYVRRYSPRAYQRRQGRTPEPGQLYPAPEEEGGLVQVLSAQTDQELLAITPDGKAYTLDVAEIPATTQRQGRGTPLAMLLPPGALGEGGTLVDQRVLTPESLTQELLLLTESGRIKRVPLQELTQLTGRGLTLLKLKGEDSLAQVALAQPGGQVAIATTSGRLLLFPFNDETLPPMGRAAQGPQALRLRKQEQVVGLCHSRDRAVEVVLISRLGYGQRLSLGDIALGTRGGLGTQAFLFAKKGDMLQAMGLALPDGEITLLTTQGRMAQVPMASLPLRGRTSPSRHRVVALEPGEEVAIVQF